MGLITITSQLSDGVVDERFGNGARKNRKTLTKSLKAEPIVMIPDHGTKIIGISTENYEYYLGQRPKCDALVANEHNLPIGVMPADCCGIVLYHENCEDLAVVHAGWKGSRDEIVTKTINYMAEQRKSRVRVYAKNLVVKFSPAICGDCYTMNSLLCSIHQYKSWNIKNVGDPRVSYINQIVEIQATSFNVDIKNVNMQQLKKLGISNISDDTRCTYECEDLPSFTQYRTKEPQSDIEDRRFLFAAAMVN